MIEMKDYTNINSVIEELYLIKKEEKGFFSKKIVEIEELTSRRKENYIDGNLTTYESIDKNKRIIGKITYFPDGSSEEERKKEFQC